MKGEILYQKVVITDSVDEINQILSDGSYRVQSIVPIPLSGEVALNGEECTGNLKGSTLCYLLAKISSGDIINQMTIDCGMLNCYVSTWQALGRWNSVDRIPPDVEEMCRVEGKIKDLGFITYVESINVPGPGVLCLTVKDTSGNVVAWATTGWHSVDCEAIRV